MGKRKISITLDDRKYSVAAGSTILEAARESGVYIPTLCAHGEMSPFGGCRMCIVEVEGMRGLPTSCTTPVADGMKVMTNTAQVHKERVEILQLILSEHTSSCLICDERSECSKSMTTIRKVGVTTGCRYCPNDHQCELQDVVEYLGVEEIGYPVYYRNLRVEKEDPFYDRDYNLCILCGRCIRMCQEVRMASTLAFKQRGRYTVIGPAFDRTHLEAGCEFCGACVSSCPTGALSEKSRKWEGNPDRTVTTTCVFCGTGCRLDLQVSGDRVIGALPSDSSPASRLQLCVKGRFCVPETVNSHKRIKKPYTYREGHKVETGWDEAVSTAAAILSSCRPEEFGMIVPADASCEDLYIAQKFTRAVMRSHNINSDARLFYGRSINAWLDLFDMSVPVSAVSKSDLILAIGIDTRYGRSVVGVEVRKAISDGARLVTINPDGHNLKNIADIWVRPPHGGEGAALKRLMSSYMGRSTNDRDIAHASAMLREARAITILVGSRYASLRGGDAVLEKIKALASKVGAGIAVLPPQSNFVGSVVAGAYSEILPGGLAAADRKNIATAKKGMGTSIPAFGGAWRFDSSAAWKKIKVLYLMGDFPARTFCTPDHIIYQGILHPGEELGADLVLPSTAFTESEGTLISGEGRIQRLKKAVDPPGEARPDWKILGMIAKKMGAGGFDHSSVGRIRKEMSFFLEGMAGGGRKKTVLPGKARLAPGKRQGGGGSGDGRTFPIILNAYAQEDLNRGRQLSYSVAGADVLFASGRMNINPSDARRFRIADGDETIVTASHREWTWSARLSEDQQPGSVSVVLPHEEISDRNPQRVNIRKK